MKINIGKYSIEITVTNNSVYSRIDRLLRERYFINAIKELRAYRTENGGDNSLIACKKWCENRRAELSAIEKWEI